MILLHIISDDEEQAIEIANFLIEKDLILDATLLEKVSLRKKINNKIESLNKTLIMGKTKALLFDAINELLKEKYKENMPVMYSLPIIFMDWEQSKELANEMAKA
tara:strand:+ start:144 stop:458 length:315 start_codon:yes stop_codon:yes gene_type:complete